MALTDNARASLTAADDALADVSARLADVQDAHDAAIAERDDRIRVLQARIAELEAQQQPPPVTTPTIRPRHYPTDAGLVRPAATESAIRQAILDNDQRDGQPSPHLGYFSARTILIPEGTVAVSAPLAAVGSAVCLAGAGRTYSTLDAGATAGPVLDPGSRLSSNQGNSGFANHVRDLTLVRTAGAAGPGVRWDAANTGCMERVTVRGGAVGIELSTTTGPSLIDDVLIEGCRVGVDGDQAMPNDTVITRLTVRGADTAIVSDSKNLTCEDLTVEGAPLVYRATSVHATLIVVGGSFTGGQGGPALQVPPGGFVHLRDVHLDGYDEIVPGVPVPADGLVREWSTHPYRRGGSVQLWANAHASLRLPAPHAPEAPVIDPASWVRVGGADLAAALEAADTPGATLYLPYGSYTLTRNITLRHAARIVGCFSQITGSGALTLAPAAGQTMWLEDVAVGITVVHDGAGDVVMRHLGTGGGALDVRTGPNATGRWWLEDWGPHAAAVIDRPVQVFGRQINREGSDWTISGGATVRLLGDNVETDVGRGDPHLTVTDATVEVLGGTWDNLGDASRYPRTGTAWLTATRSRVALVMPSLLRSGGVIGAWVTDDGVRVTDAALVKQPPRGTDQRCAMPLYVSP